MKPFLFTILSVFALANCGSDASTANDVETAGTDVTAAAETALPDAVTQPWNAATASYLELKDALVTSDYEAAKQSAAALAMAIGQADMGAMGETHDTWMAATPDVRSAAQAVVDAGSIEDARVAFSKLTPPMVAAIKQLGDGGQDLFVQHCPMIFDNAGADWVSNEREVRNPYYGDAMLKCGKVTEEL